MSYNITDVINAAISLIKNILILTDDPERYKAYLKYGIIAYSIEELINRFKKLLEGGKIEDNNKNQYCSNRELRR
jgi:hypothetical protein